MRSSPVVSSVSDDEDDDGISFVGLILAPRPLLHAYGQSSAAGSSSPRPQRRIGAFDASKRDAGDAGDAATSRPEPGPDTSTQSEKRKRHNEADRSDERLVSQELQLAATDEAADDKSTPSPSKKPRVRKTWTLEEDNIIAEHLMKNFDAAQIQSLTGRPASSIYVRIKIFLREALRRLHGDSAVVSAAAGRSDPPRDDDSDD